jgi:hypothetical protein
MMAKKVTKWQDESGGLHDTMGAAIASEQKSEAIQSLYGTHYHGCCEDVSDLLEYLAENKALIFKAMEWRLFPCLGDGE